MSQPLVSPRKARILAFSLFLIGLGLIAFFDAWWPGIMLVVGIPLALREYLLGRDYETGIMSFLFLGVFFTVQFKLGGQILLPVLFTLGGIYLFLREEQTARAEKRAPLEEPSDPSE